VVVRNGLHGLLDELVALIFKLLSISVLSCVDTSTVVVVLRSGRRRSIAVSWDDIVDAKLLGDFLDTQMQCVGLKLFTCHAGQDSSGQAHEASRLVLGCITPSVSLLSSSRSISFAARLGIASTLQVAIDSSVAIKLLLLISEATLPERDVVGTGDSLASPRHFRAIRDQTSDALGKRYMMVQKKT